MTRHAPLRATWSEGQRWETRNEDSEQWVPVGNRGYAEPMWDERQEYRRMEEAPALTLEEARRIVSEHDVSDPARTIEAVAVLLRFEGIADPSLLPIAEQLVSAAGGVRRVMDRVKETDHG